MKSIAVLFGGRSSEHEISIITALQAMTALDTSIYNVSPVYIHPNGKWYTGKALFDKGFYKRFDPTQLKQVSLLPEPGIGGLIPIVNQAMQFKDRIPVDLYFLAFHGQYGEDGAIQGLLEMANVAYTGCGVAASAVTMNKYLSKMYLKAHGIPVLPAVTIDRTIAQRAFSQTPQFVLEQPGLDKFPLFVKPAHLGSSIGISRVETLLELQAALAKVFKYDDQAMIEPCVMNPLEVNIAVLGGNPPIASVVEIPITTSGCLTYEDKYLRGSKKVSHSSGMASLSRVIDPSDLDGAVKNRITEYAIKAYQLLGCKGVSRLDFMIDRQTNQLYFNELNSVPGSLAFYLWEKTEPRLLYTEVLDRMIKQAEERHGEQASLQREIGFKALSS